MLPSTFFSYSFTSSKHFIKSQKRLFSIKEKKVTEKKYSHTVRLPKTKFPQWLSSQRRVELDEIILKTCGFNELYSWQRKHLTGQEFILHDGPPYANGPAHMGHALNKILKDIIIRQKLLQGFKIHYKPGWDCHGLPIELKALNESVAQKLSPLEIRQRARKFAKRAISDQKAAFKSWGILAEWDKECYYTFDVNYIVNQLQQFYKLFEKGFIYRDMKPVYWSPATKSALAEAELEYNSDHRSSAWTVRMPLLTNTSWPSEIWNITTTNIKLYALIWTTTPWTLPANRAIAFNQDITYAFVQFSKLDGIYIVAEALIPRLEKSLNSSSKVLATISGKTLKDCKYKHPLTNEDLPFFHGTHVTSDTGTGLVHSAPAHGHEDFLLALANNISFKCLVNEHGVYTTDVNSSLHNLSVLSDNTQRVLSTLLGDSIICKEEITHSYPYDWRTNTPVIIRASKQWFIKTDAVKEQSLAALKDVNIIPSRNVSALVNQVESRPYWCISRQRSWGVPIPVLYKKSAEEEYLINRELIDNYCHLLRKHGPDFWWSLDINDIVPENISKKMNIKLDQWKKGEDILDIWLDSGLSWSSVLEGKTADVYLEGTDQSTGWFQSSLLTSVALTGSAPYKNVYIHGFALDGEGRKMSKSLGNVIDPQSIIRGSTIDQTKNAMGIDVLRWWVAAHGSQHTNVPVSETTLDNSIEALKKLRNVFKFLLGSIHDLPKDYVQRPPSAQLSVIDMYLLHSLATFLSTVYEMYDSYQFNKVCNKIINFITNEVSSLYLPLIKDKLYCDGKDNERRKNVQYTLYHILNSITKAVAPITPILVEEVFKYHPLNTEKKPFFQSVLPGVPHSELSKTKEEVDNIIEKALEIKNEFLKECPLNINSVQLWCNLTVGNDLLSLLQPLQNETTSTTSELVNILQVSGITLNFKNDIQHFKIDIASTDFYKCPRCWKFNTDAEDMLCSRCSEVVKEF